MSNRIKRYALIYCAGVITGVLIGGIAMLPASPIWQGSQPKYSLTNHPRYAIQTADFKSVKRYDIYCDPTIGGEKECGYVKIDASGSLALVAIGVLIIALRGKSK